MQTKNITNRRVAEYDIRLIESLSDEDLQAVASACAQLEQAQRKRGPAAGLIVWLKIALQKEHRRRRFGEQAEQTMIELPAEIYAECPSAIGINLVACNLLLRCLEKDSQTAFVGEVLHDLCILSKARLDNYAHLISQLEYK